MSVRVSETETKYEVPDGTGMPPLDELPFGQLTGVSAVSEPDEKLLDAEYYDTDDLRLIRSGITLRRRTGGSDDGWHLKLPDGADTRQEIRLPPGQRGVPPAELAGLVRAYVRGAELRPVARMATRRQTVVLLDGAGEPLAEVASDDVHAEALGDSAAVSRWHEVEVELTGGDRPLLRSAGELLRRQGLVQADRAAKLERALGDRLPRPAEPPRLTPQSPAGEVVLAYLRKQAKAIMTLDPAGQERAAIVRQRARPGGYRAPVRRAPLARRRSWRRPRRRGPGRASQAEPAGGTGGAADRPGAGAGAAALRLGADAGTCGGAGRAGLAAVFVAARRDRPAARRSAAAEPGG